MVDLGVCDKKDVGRRDSLMCFLKRLSRGEKDNGKKTYVSIE